MSEARCWMLMYRAILDGFSFGLSFNLIYFQLKLWKLPKGIAHIFDRRKTTDPILGFWKYPESYSPPNKKHPAPQRIDNRSVSVRRVCRCRLHISTCQHLDMPLRVLQRLFPLLRSDVHSSSLKVVVNYCKLFNLCYSHARSIKYNAILSEYILHLYWANKKEVC